MFFKTEIVLWPNTQEMLGLTKLIRSLYHRTSRALDVNMHWEYQRGRNRAGHPYSI